MKWPKSILWLASRKSSPYAYLIAGALVFVLVVAIGQVWYQSKCKNRLRATRVYLGATRESIQAFYEYKGRYPDSLDEFRRCAQAGGSGVWEKMLVDLTSDRQSDVPEYRELNDKGGYYYDPNSGEIRLNLTRPVSEYFKWYRGPLKDEVPSSW